MRPVSLVADIRQIKEPYLAVFAVKLRESMKAYLSDRDDWPTSYYSELLLDTLLEDFTSAEIKDLDVWYGKHEMQEEVCSVSYKISLPMTSSCKT